ncbi:MAG TPA: GNAT family N-acetyltransferase [Actinomycetota bacterium]|nr:GNAT family N-acetyltransferase [Actinomycetota bacterium]
MDIQIRAIGEDEFEAYANAVETAFGSFVDAADLERERSIAELDRSFAAFDGDRIVGTAATLTMPMTVPGAELEVGFVTAVGVLPTHTRRGINTALMLRTLEDARDRGEAVDVLFASEGGIYGRFGYGMSAPELTLDVRTTHAAFIRGYRPSGAVRLVGAEEGMQGIITVHGSLRHERPGAIELTPTRLNSALHDHGEDKGKPRFFALHEGQEGVDGYLAYRVKHDWATGTPENHLEIHLLDGSSPGAYADLWRYAFDVDLVARVTAWARPADEPLVHLVREPRRLNARHSDGLYLRVVDVPAALEARRYAAAGRVVLQVHDPFCAWNEGRFALEGGPDGSACARTDEEPDLIATVSEIGATYLGGPSFRQLHRAGRVSEERAGALARADAMFGWDPAPWCAFGF